MSNTIAAIPPFVTVLNYQRLLPNPASSPNNCLGPTN